MKTGDNIMFVHENGRMIPGVVKSPTAPGPGGEHRAVIHVTPAVLMFNGFDREKRHREYGIDRQVPHKRIMELSTTQETEV